MIHTRYQLQRTIKILLGVITSLTIIGLIFIYSSSSVFALEQQGSAYYFFKKQLVGMLLGTIGALICYCIPFHILKKYSSLFFASSWLLTLGTLIPGLSRTIHGSSRWLTLFGLSFQPSELLKVALVIYLASFLSRKKEDR